MSRLQNFIDLNTRILIKNKLRSEIILVNWNPIEEQQSITDGITWNTDSEYVRYRVITVPNALHQEFVDEQKRKTVPLFEFIAKNVGIKRAQGEYILASNADILISEDIIKSIAQKKLNADVFYRANRLDFDHVDPLLLENEAQFFKHASHVSLKGFLYSFKWKCCQSFFYLCFKLVNIFRVKWELFKNAYPNIFNFLSISVTYDISTFWAHCLNSGDFMLMTKTNWERFRAYPEYTHISTHTDALFTILCLAELQESVFSCPVYHQNHERRYQWDAIKSEGVFKTAFDDFQKISQDVILNGNLDKHLNNSSWGLKDYSLNEILINA